MTGDIVPEEASLWFVTRQLDPEATVAASIGRHENTRATIILMRKSEGRPIKEKARCSTPPPGTIRHHDSFSPCGWMWVTKNKISLSPRCLYVPEATEGMVCSSTSQPSTIPHHGPLHFSPSSFVILFSACTRVNASAWVAVPSRPNRLGCCAKSMDVR